MAKSKSGETVFIVTFTSGGTHPFGSIAAIFDMFSAKSLGVSQSRLYQVDIEDGKPYKNKVCTITKSTMHRKPGKRSNPTTKTQTSC